MSYRPLFGGLDFAISAHEITISDRVGLAHMDAYRLLLYSDDGQLVGSARVVHAANDAEAIARAEAMRGSLAAELLDVDGLRIVKYVPDGRSHAAK